jgi:hypothetical protein
MYSGQNRNYDQQCGMMDARYDPNQAPLGWSAEQHARLASGGTHRLNEATLARLPEPARDRESPELDHAPLRRYQQAFLPSNDSPIQRFLAPGAEHDPRTFSRRELAQLGMRPGDGSSLEMIQRMADRNVALSRGSSSSRSSTADRHRGV